MSGSGAQNRPILSVRVRLLHGDIRRLYEALARIIERDPNVRAVPGSQPVRVLGTDEAQLEQVIARIQHKFGLILEVGEPEVVYLESIQKAAESESKFLRQIGGSGNYAHVKLRLEPIDPEVIAFVATIDSRLIPSKYIPAVEQGIREAAMRGVQGGHEIVGLSAVLYDGSYHETDSNEMAFRTAGETAFNEAVAKAGRVLLEPIMAIEITVPEEYTEIVKRDFLNRRGRITDSERRENTAVIHAIAPLAGMLGYKSPELKMHFLRYAEAPPPEEHGEAGVIARTPRGPKPKHGFTSLPEPE